MQSQKYFESTGGHYSYRYGWGGVVRPGLGPEKVLLLLRDDCALFCAHTTSKIIADGSCRAGKQITRTGAENQHHSKLSHSVIIAIFRTHNPLVLGSNPSGPTKLVSYSDRPEPEPASCRVPFSVRSQGRRGEPYLLDSGGRYGNLRATRDPSERGLLAQIVGTENYRNVSEERPQSQQADKLGTRVKRSCTKVGAVTLVRAITVEGVCAGTGSQFRLLGCRTPHPSEGVSPYRSGCSRLLLLLAWGHTWLGGAERRIFRCAWL
jgi:hypothetical protein